MASIVCRPSRGGKKAPFETVATFHDKKNNNVTVNIALQPLKKAADVKDRLEMAKNDIFPMTVSQRFWQNILKLIPNNKYILRIF